MKTKFFLKNLEKGQILPILVIGILVMIMMAALMIDGGMLMAHRRTAQAAADAGALGGAAYLCPNDYNSSTAMAVADQYALANINLDHKSSSGTTFVTLVSSNTIRVETSVTSSPFFARIFDQLGLTAGAEAEASCTPLSLVTGALPFVFPCDPAVDELDPDKATFGNCRVVYGDPSYGNTREENIQWHVDNDKMTILLTSDSVTVECYDEEDNPDGNVECGDNVVAMGDRGWISLTEEGKRQDLQKWIAGGEQHKALLGIGYWVSSFSGVDTNLYLNHIANIVDQDRVVPIYNKECGQTYPSDKCPTLFETGDNEEEIRHPGATGQSNYRINAFSLFRITCVYPIKGNAECPYRNKLISQGIIPNNNSVKSVEGYFISGITPDGSGGGPDFLLYTVQLTK